MTTLEVIAEKVNSCTRCEGSKAAPPLSGRGSLTSCLLVVTPVVTPEEDLLGGMLEGREGQAFRHLLDAAGLEWYATALVKCHHKPGRDAWDACRAHLDAELAALRPRAVLTLGKEAAVRLLGAPRPAPLADYAGLEMYPPCLGGAAAWAWYDVARVYAGGLALYADTADLLDTIKEFLSADDD
jgi:uracil-DNA glycosylase